MFSKLGDILRKHRLLLSWLFGSLLVSFGVGALNESPSLGVAIFGVLVLASVFVDVLASVE